MNSLDHALAALGLSLTDLQRSAEQIVLFGSRAADVAHDSSDWDILIVGSGRSRRTPAVDLVCVTPRELASDEWLSSELSGHVARWGRWLHGAPDWTAQVTFSAAAAERKARRLASRLAALERAWELFSVPYRCKHQALIRRDLQRYAHLSCGEAVPPSPCLDEVWKTWADPRGEMLRLGHKAGVCSGFFEEEVACPDAIFADGNLQESRKAVVSRA